MDALIRSIGTAASWARHGRKLSILIYHRVLPEPDDLRPKEVIAADFATHMEALADCFNVLPLGAAVDLLDAGRLPPRAISVTFDDGYRDNESVALPILRRHGIPATFFVATGFLDGGRMWNDSIIEAVRIADGDALDLRGEGLGDFAAAAGTDRCGAVAGLIAALKYLPPDERAVKVDRIVARVGKPLPDDLMMTSEQVRGLASAGMEIGAHTVGHPILKGLADEAARWEVGHSREELAGIAGRPIELFAYPNGRPGLDYTRRDVDIVRGAGFRAAVSTALGAAAPGADRWQLPRFAPWHRERRPFALRLIRNYGRISAGAA